jgi:DNA-binding MarR family transcriptional regulator
MRMSPPDLPETPSNLRGLIERLGRLIAAQDWEQGLNPSQAAALRYLLRANRFSRAPSHVADYLGTTRGTVSQTLMALQRKGLVGAQGSQSDRRSLTYAVTAAGEAALAGTSLDAVLADLPPEAAGLDAALRAVLGAVLRAQGGHSFGLCRTCVHHVKRDAAGYCQLLSVPLLRAEHEQVCHEHAERSA